MKFFSIIIFALFLTSSTMAEERSDSMLVRELRQEGITFTNDNHIHLLMSGQEKFDDMFAEIKKAKHSIHLEYFNFRNDSIAMLLFDILAERASHGVEVRALFDDFGNMSNNQPLKKYHLEDLWKRGIQIYKFDAIKFPWVNHIFGRDHRKIVVIDGETAYTGGMNVADYYINGTKQVGEWRDMHCCIKGSEVNTLQRIFLEMWHRVTGEVIVSKEYFQGKDASSENIDKKGIMAGIVNREPYRTPKAVRNFYRHAIDCAKDTIRIVNPYFTLIPSIKKALFRALKRGVNVQVMLSAKCDEPVTPDVGYLNGYKLAKEGCEVYIYKTGFHHTKIIMVDGKYCTVGSTNLDARSLKCDYEENVAIIDKNITRQLTNMFERDKQKSYLMTPEVYNQSFTAWERFRARLFSAVLSPFL